jgi:hypothetical protein
MNVEYDVSFWSADPAKVPQVGIATALNTHAGGREMRQIFRHVECRSPVEGEG